MISELKIEKNIINIKPVKMEYELFHYHWWYKECINFNSEVVGTAFQMKNYKENYFKNFTHSFITSFETFPTSHNVVFFESFSSCCKMVHFWCKIIIKCTKSNRITYVFSESLKSNVKYYQQRNLIKLSTSSTRNFINFIVNDIVEYFGTFLTPFDNSDVLYYLYHLLSWR